MGKVNQLTNTRSIVDDKGILTQEGRLTFNDLFARIPITGTGSPEGVVDARSGATYYNLSAGTGAIHYVKMTDSVDDGTERNTTKGWQLA